MAPTLSDARRDSAFSAVSARTLKRTVVLTVLTPRLLHIVARPTEWFHGSVRRNTASGENKEVKQITSRTTQLRLESPLDCIQTKSRNINPSRRHTCTRKVPQMCSPVCILRGNPSFVSSQPMGHHRDICMNTLL